MGTELSKQTAEGEDGWAASALPASVPAGIAQQCEATQSTTITTAAAVAQWHAWLQLTENLYIKGRIKDCREVGVAINMAASSRTIYITWDRSLFFQILATSLWCVPLHFQNLIRTHCAQSRIPEAKRLSLCQHLPPSIENTRQHTLEFCL